VRISRHALIAVTGVSVGLAGLLAGPADAGATARPAVVRPASTAVPATGGLTGTAAVSKSGAWAVGYTGKISAPRILLLRWNGTAWSRVTSPSVLTAAGELTAITAVSAKSAWAVGYTGRNGTGKNHSLLLHWNGSRWSQVTSPAPVTGGSLAAITVQAKSGWAVGYVNTDPSAPLCCAGSPLVFRWNGAKWSRLAAAKLGKGAYLNGVAMTATNRAWATGGPLAMITGALASWNGSTWAWASDPIKGAYRPLNGIAAGPGGIAFTVGTNNDTPGPPVSARWNGKTWRTVTVSAPKGTGLNAVTFAPGGTAWAAGDGFSGASFHPLIMRWNGKAWTRVASPGTSQLDGLAFSARTYGWAVGSTSTASGASRIAILHWNGRAWTQSRL
jgi:hypothetical protein